MPKGKGKAPSAQSSTSAPPPDSDSDSSSSSVLSAPTRSTNVSRPPDDSTTSSSSSYYSSGSRSSSVSTSGSGSSSVSTSGSGSSSVSSSGSANSSGSGSSSVSTSSTGSSRSSSSSKSGSYSSSSGGSRSTSASSDDSISSSGSSSSGSSSSGSDSTSGSTGSSRGSSSSGSSSSTESSSDSEVSETESGQVSALTQGSDQEEKKDDKKKEDSESEDELPPPPPHVMAKQQAEKMRKLQEKQGLLFSPGGLGMSPLDPRSFGLTAGLNPVQPDGTFGVPRLTTTLKARANVGQTAIEINKASGVKAGYKLYIGSGVKVDVCDVVLGGEVADRVVVSYPLAYRHNAGATVLAFSTPTADEMEDAREKLVEYQLQQRELLRQAAEEEAAAKREAAATADEEDTVEKEDDASVVSGLSGGSQISATDSKPIKQRESLFPDGDKRRQSSIASSSRRRSTHARDLKLRSGSIRSSKVVDLETFNTGTPTTSEPPSDSEEEDEDKSVKSKSSSMMDAVSEAMSQQSEELDFSGKTPAEIALAAVEEGYETVKARFEGYGDDFEDMFFKFSENQRWLRIRVLSGNGEIKFDVGGGGCFVTENASDETSCYMDYRENVISFKMGSAKRIQNFMDEFPATVFDYEDEEEMLKEIEEKGKIEKTEAEKKEYEKKEHTPYVSQQAQARKTRVQQQLNKLKDVKNKKTLDQILETLEAGRSFRPGMSTRQTLGLRGQRVVGAVEGLQKDAISRGEGGGTYTPFSDGTGGDDMKGIAPPRAPISSPDGADRWIKPPRSTPNKRQELINQRIRKTTPSAKRTKMLCRWLNFLEFWDKELTVKGLHTEMCSGECLCELMKVLVPTCAKREISSYNIKPLARKPAINNIEKALGVVYRSREFNRSRIPDASAIFEGNINKIIILLDELFVVYMQQPLYKNAPRMLKWYQKILRQYRRPLPDEVLDDGNVSSVWPSFQNGVSLFCVICHFYGPIIIGQGETTIKIDPMRVVSFPDNYDDIRANLIYVFSLLKALEIEALWTPDEWLTYPDTEFAILQLSYVYEALRGRQCNLPAASGTTAGLTTGPDGEALVVGLTFSDTRAAGLNVHRHSKHVTALLGAGENSIPMIPVDNSQTYTGNVTDSLLSMAPMGLLSAAVRVQERNMPVQVPLTQKSTNRPKWQSSTGDDNFRVTENLSDAPMLNVLHSQHQPVRNSTEYIEGKKPRFAAASKKPLSALRREMLLSQQSKQRADTTAVILFDKDKLSASINQMIMETSRVDDRGEEIIEDEDAVAVRQLKMAMQRLEEEMNFTHKEIDGLEEELDARYMLLEEEAEDLDEEEYDKALEYLDGEGVRLENDKLRISELFSIRLKSIREQFQEAKIRAAAAKQTRKEEAERQEHEARKRKGNLNERFQSVADDDTSTVSGDSTLRTSGSLQAKIASNYKRALSDKEKKKREEGWTLHNNKSFSYNAKIQENIVRSSSKLKDHWMSPRTKQRLENKAQVDAEKLAKKIGLDNMPKSPIGGHKALLMEKGTAASIGKDSIRSAGSSKSGQYYPGSEYTLAAHSKHAHSHFETPEQVFDQFKIRLYTKTSVWLNKRGLERADGSGGHNAPKKQEVSYLIQLMATTKPFSNAQDLCDSIKGGTDTQTAISMHLSQEQINLWSLLRNDEKDRIAWEETRADMAKENPAEVQDDEIDEEGAKEEEKDDAEDVKKGVTIVAGDESPIKGGNDIASPSKSASSPGMGGAMEYKEEREEAVTDLATALRHCSKGRNYVLNDRKSAEYMWNVERVEMQGLSGNTKKGEGPLNSFVLKWKTRGGVGNTLVEAGSVLLEDLKSIDYDPILTKSRTGREEGTITLNLKSSVRALKTCGGRTKLVLKCIQPAEDAKWFMCLKCLFKN